MAQGQALADLRPYVPVAGDQQRQPGHLSPAFWTWPTTPTRRPTFANEFELAQHRTPLGLFLRQLSAGRSGRHRHRSVCNRSANWADGIKPFAPYVEDIYKLTPKLTARSRASLGLPAPVPRSQESLDIPESIPHQPAYQLAGNAAICRQLWRRGSQLRLQDAGQDLLEELGTARLAWPIRIEPQNSYSGRLCAVCSPRPAAWADAAARPVAPDRPALT